MMERIEHDKIDSIVSSKMDMAPETIICMQASIAAVLE